MIGGNRAPARPGARPLLVPLFQIARDRAASAPNGDAPPRAIREAIRCNERMERGQTPLVIPRSPRRDSERMATR